VSAAVRLLRPPVTVRSMVILAFIHTDVVAGSGVV
jgi:hypothetical protein